MAEHTSTEADSDEWEEEETTVVVELSGILESDFISQCDGNCKVLGIDTDRPLLQLDRYTFSGEYCDTMGTNLIFTQEDAIIEEPKPFQETIESPTKKLDYFCKVDKKLNMSRVFVSKTPQDQADKDIDDIDDTVEEREMETSDTDRTTVSADIELTVATQQPEKSSASPSSHTETYSAVPNLETHSVVPGSEIPSTVPGSETQSVVPGSETQSVVPGSETLSVVPSSEISSAVPDSEISSTVSIGQEMDTSDAASVIPEKQSEPDG